MYQPTSLKFNPDQVAELRRLALSLDPQPGPGGSGMTEYEPTAALFWPVLKSYFSWGWNNARIVGLWPSQQIPLHVDAYLPSTRFHIPLQTNDDCWVWHRGWQQLAEGQTYTVDPTVPHGAVNWGSEIRFHLMIDSEPL